MKTVRLAWPATTRCVLGAFICAATAAGMTALFAQHSGRGNLPLVFLAVITLVALYLGAAAGVAGTVSAAIVFALFLFPPIGSPLVEDFGERSSVGWMLLGGIAISYLFAPRQSGDSNRPSE